MIKFRSNTTLNIVDDFDERADKVVAQHEETFTAGELVDADVISEPVHGHFDIQFAKGGGVAFAVFTDCFEVVKA